ncbi:hypothetical protein [Microvirga splendida]|uniref:PepSY domain-containing protein n=1 Tax=Microvirga splendida TaxID=2795727 RepID=A0ABS0Y3E7_9HYPH|nr:hypothetical protein [Microvirga splendida]MBJ6126817.1 hypothetical protein [Microvirga splendida]
MQRKSVAMFAAALLVGCGSSAAFAQSQMEADQTFGSNRPSINRDWIPGALSPSAQRQGDSMQYNRAWPAGDISAAGNSSARGQASNAQSRFNQRVMLRQQLRQAGFQNIRILNATYLVQARTPDGRSVIMVVDPQSASAPEATASVGRQSQQSDSSNATGQNRNSAPLLDPRQVRLDLQSRGFSNISNLSRDGYTYTATADWRGQEMNVRVDGRTGMILEPRPLTPGQMQGLQNN